MGIVGPRGYPGSKGLVGDSGNKGDKGDSGVGATVVDNGDGTFTISGANGSIVLRNGADPSKGTDYFDGNTGDFVSSVYAKIPIGDPAPTIDAGTGTFDGVLETMPTGSVAWFDEPDYSVGFTTYLSKNRYKHDVTTGGSGTWSLRNNAWSTPRIFTDNIAIQGRLVSYAFIRDVTQPTTPSGGNYDSPLPTTAGWTDGIPSGTTPVYMAKRLFTSDALPPEDIAWSVPRLLGESGSGTKFQFGFTSSGPWHDIPLESDEWMIVCTQDNAGAYICDTANSVKIKGEVGVTAQSKFNAYAFKRSLTNLSEQPTGGDFDFPFPVDGVITGWTSNIPAGTAPLYVSTRMFTSDGLIPQDGTWAISQLFSGEGAVNFFITVNAQIFSYDTENNNPAPIAVTFTAHKQNLTDGVIWTTDPVTTIAANVGAQDTLLLTAAEFGTLETLRVTATAGTFTDDITIVRVKDGPAGSSGVATEIRQVKFQFAPDASGSPGTWHDSPMVPTDDWMREGTFYDDVLQGSYSVGNQITGDDGANTYTEFWFGDANASGNPDSTPADWTQTQGASDVYIISRTITLGIASAWGAIAQIRGDDGVDGKYFETRFFKRSLALGAPADPTDYNKTAELPVGWATDPNIATSGDEVIWAITATKLFDGTLDTDWSAISVQWGAYTPRQGTDYSDGTGVYLSKVYIEAVDGFNTPPTVNTGSWDGLTEVLPNGGWRDDPLSPTAGNYIYESSFLYVSTLVSGINTWPATAGTWSTPTKYAYIPVLGTDYFNGTAGNGTFHSYIFQNIPIGNTLVAPTDGSYDGTTEVVPASWTDSPITAANDQVTMVSERTYVVINDVWQAFPAWSDPAEFSAISALVGVLTNDTDSVISDFNGNNIVYNSDEGGNFLVYFGTLEVTTDCTFTIAGGAVSAPNHTLTQNSLTMSINQNTGVYTVTGPLWNSDRESFTLVATHDVSGTIATKKYSLTKIKTGDVGISGTANRLDLAYGTSITGGTVNYPTLASAASSTNKTHMGTNVVTWIPPVTEPAISNTTTDYEWTLLTGADGLDGAIGKDGVDGADGLDGAIGNDGLDGSSAYTLLNTANTTLTPSTVTGNSSTAWISGAYSLEQYAGASFASCKFGTKVDGMMFGLSDNDGTDAHFNTIDYAIYMVADGSIYIYESGSNKGHQIAAVDVDITSDVFAVVNTGNSVKYLRNGLVLYTSLVIPSGAYRFDCSFAGNGDKLSEISFGPIGGAGLSTRVDFAYSDNDNGVGNFNTGTAGATNKYIGTNAVTWVSDAIEPAVSTVPGDYEWSLYTGSDGANAITIINYTPASSVTTDSAGNSANYGNTATTIAIYEGDVQLTYDGTGTADGTWEVSSTTNVDIAVGALSDGGLTAKYAETSGMTADTAFITYQIAGKRLNGGTFTSQATQVFSKVKQGEGAISLSLTNSNHSIPCNELSTVFDFANSGTDIHIYQGGTELDYVGAGVAGAGTADGTWLLAMTGQNVIAGGLSDFGLYVSVSPIQDWSGGVNTTTGSITHTISGKTINGELFTIIALQTFNKVIGAIPATFEINTNSGSAGTITTHKGIGNDVTITWGYSQSGENGGFDGTDSDGDYIQQAASCTYRLFRDTTEIDSIVVVPTITLLNYDWETGEEPETYFYDRMFCVFSSRVYVDTGTVNNVTHNYTITKSVNYTPISTDTGTIGTTEQTV